MPDLGSELLKKIISPGSVFYYPEKNFVNPNRPHYFVVLNYNPREEDPIIMVWATSQIAKREKWRKKIKAPPETLVIVTPNEYPAFKKNSIFDCNQAQKITLENLIQKLRIKSLTYKGKISSNLLNKLRKAVVCSPQIEEDIKEILKE